MQRARLRRCARFLELDADLPDELLLVLVALLDRFAVAA